MECCLSSVAGAREFRTVPVVNLNTDAKAIPVRPVVCLNRVEERLIPFYLLPRDAFSSDFGIRH